MRLARILATLPFAIAAAAIAACQTADHDSGTTDTDTTDEAIEQSFGGQTTVDEQPGFGDPALSDGTGITTGAEAETDPAAEPPPLTNPRHVRILVAWGYLRPQPGAEAVDWSGNITAVNAGLRVIRPVLFEHGDTVVLPRTDIHVVEMASTTTSHMDGLLLDVVIAPELNPEHGAITLTFNSGPFTDTLTLEPGMRLSKVTPVDDAGHVVAYHVIRPDADGCAEGFVFGRWAQAPGADAERGRVLGVLVGGDGAPRGHLKGVFGVRANGHQVWFAKVIDRDGRFRGVFAGRYNDDGRFTGLFLTGGDRTVRGMVHGAITPGEGDEAGEFAGRFSERCGEDPREGTPTGSDEPALPAE